MNKLVLGCITLILAGCAGSGPQSSESPTRSFELVAADLLVQLEGDLAVAVAPPIASSTVGAEGEDLQRIRRYPDRLLAALVRARRPGSKVRFVTREHLTLLLREQGLQWSELVPTDPKTRVKLEAITAVQAYLVWRINRGLKDYSWWRSWWSGGRLCEDWTLMVVSVQTGEVLAASKAHRLWL